jgi:hypothetical protein
MTMAASIGSELVMMLALMGGGGDIVSALPAKEYFEFRQIEPALDKLIELAATEPATGKAQIAQLFALKQLASEAAALKKSPQLADYRQVLKEIAAGKKGADKTGFAAEYASRVLTALDGAKAPLVVRGNWRQGAAWIPGHVTFLAGFDSKDRKPGDPLSPDLTSLVRLLPKEAMTPMFTQIEKLGNIRLERLVVGVAQGADDSPEVFVRLTGKANPKWIGDAFADSATITEKSIAGREVRLVELRGGGGEPDLAIVDDSDLLIAGVATVKVKKLGVEEKPEPAPKRAAQVEKMLGLMRGGSDAGASAVMGSLKEDLAKVPVEASMIAIGTVPATMRLGMPIPLPEKIFAHGFRGAGGADLRLKGTMSGENDAKQFAQTVTEGRDAGLKQLAQIQGKAPPGLNPTALAVMLQSIQVQSEGSAIQMQMLVPNDALISLPAMWFIGR